MFMVTEHAEQTNNCEAARRCCSPMENNQRRGQLYSKWLLAEYHFDATETAKRPSVEKLY
jgi:hypothetical protein